MALKRKLEEFDVSEVKEQGGEGAGNVAFCVELVDGSSAGWRPHDCGGNRMGLITLSVLSDGLLLCQLEGQKFLHRMGLHLVQMTVPGLQMKTQLSWNIYRPDMSSSSGSRARA